MNLYLISYGRDYYNRSGSMMPTLTHEHTGDRSDWGKVQIALDAGGTVLIRPATPEEHARMEVLTQESNARHIANGWGGPWGSTRDSPIANVQGHPCRAADGIQLDGLSASDAPSCSGLPD